VELVVNGRNHGGTLRAQHGRRRSRYSWLTLNGNDRPSNLARRFSRHAKGFAAKRHIFSSWLPHWATRGWSKPPLPDTEASKKRDLIEQARRAGWRGRGYRKAKRFERALERSERAR
jgi:hypothetical protein